MQSTLIAKSSLSSLFRRMGSLPVTVLEGSRFAPEAPVKEIVAAEAAPCPGAGIFCAFCDFCFFAMRGGK
jgi:hypothetical protein